MTASAKDINVKSPPDSRQPVGSTPRVWLITAATSPIGLALTRHLLNAGHMVAAGVTSTDSTPGIADDDYTSTPADADDELAALAAVHPSRLRLIELDIRSMAQCQSAVAGSCATFGRVDVLVCSNNFTAVGSVEEWGATEAARMVGRELFEVNFFGAVNAIKAALPGFRAERDGHIIVLTGLTGHLGTPGLGLYCASQWAIEGYCDSLAYEVAPFNVRTTIVQPHVEIGVLTSKIVSAPPLASYGNDANGAPMFRDILSSLLDKLEGREGEDGQGVLGPSTGDQLHQDRVATVYAALGSELKGRLVAETVHAVAAIGGHDNPPSRHIVGHEAVSSVKEKLKTVSEELEDFVEVSAAVDIGKEDAPTVITAP